MGGDNEDDREQSGLLELRLLGEFSSEFAGHRFNIVGAKSRALLAILSVDDTCQATREYLRGLLWSNSTETRAQDSLRDLIRKLHRTFSAVNYEGFSVTRDQVLLNTSTLVTDVRSILQSCIAGEPSAKICQDPNIMEQFLYGYEDLDEALDDWIRWTRERLKTICLERLDAWLSEVSLDPNHKKNIAKILLHHDPFNERACQSLIQALDEIGDKSGALGVYQEFWERLQEEYGEEPSDVTKNIIVEIKLRAQNLLPGLAEESQSKGFGLFEEADDRLKLAFSNAKPVILVSLYDIASIDPRRFHLLRGLKQDLLACLVRFREWFVLDAEDVDVTGVDSVLARSNYRLEISATATSDFCRVTILFKDLETGQVIWSQRFKLELDSWVTLQNSIVRRLAVALNLHLSFERLSNLHNRHGEQIVAYDSWLKGQELIHNYDPESWEEAGQLFEATRRNHPSFSRSYGSLAEMENLRHIQFPGILSNQDSQARGLEYARLAVKLDPLDSRAQLCLGWASAMNGQFARAELAFTLAYENNENDPWTLVSAAVGLAFCDQSELSTELATLALSLDITPSRVHWSYQAVIYFLNADYDKCVRACENGQEVSVDLPAWHAAALAEMGRPTEAAARRLRFVELATENWANGQAPSNTQIARWLLNCYPIRNAASLARLREGLRTAGLRGVDDAPPQIPNTS